MFVPKLLAAVLLLADAGTAQDLRVAAAADLSTVMPKLTATFEKETGTHLSVSLGSSGNFFAEIKNGAPFDVFLSADKSYPQKLQQFGFVDADSPLIYARGKLVLWIPKSSSLHFPANQDGVLIGDLNALAQAQVRHIAIASPDHAPYGRAGVAALDHYGIFDKVKDRLIYGENISQTAQFAESGNADAALIALSTALTDPMRKAGTFVLLPQESYSPLEQQAAVVKTSKNKDQARRFVHFLRSAEAQAAFRQAGFEVPSK